MCFWGLQKNRPELGENTFFFYWPELDHTLADGRSYIQMLIYDDTYIYLMFFWFNWTIVKKTLFLKLSLVAVVRVEQL